MFLKKFPSGPLETNALLLACPKEKRAAVVDPAQGSTQEILDEAARNHFSIEIILLTHSHWDHIADLSLLKEKTGALVYVHAADAPNVERPGADSLPLFFSIPGVHPDRLLKEGDEIRIGQILLEVLHTPGHSPGGVCFLCREEKVLIAGDTLFCGGIGRTDLPTSQKNQMKASLAKLALLPADTRVIPGHGEDTTISKERSSLRCLL